VGDALAGGDDDPGSRVPERDGLVEPRAYGANRVSDAFAARLLDHPPHVVRARAGLADEALTPGLDLLALGSGGEDARADGDEHALRPQLGRRDDGHLDLAVSQPLRDELHEAGVPSMNCWCQSSSVKNAQTWSAESARPSSLARTIRCTSAASSRPRRSIC